MVSHNPYHLPSRSPVGKLLAKHVPRVPLEQEPLRGRGKMAAFRALPEQTQSSDRHAMVSHVYASDCATTACGRTPPLSLLSPPHGVSVGDDVTAFHEAVALRGT